MALLGRSLRRRVDLLDGLGPARRARRPAGRRSHRAVRRLHRDRDPGLLHHVVRAARDPGPPQGRIIARTYPSWITAMMLPSESLNHAAFPPPLLAMPFTVLRPGKS